MSVCCCFSFPSHGGGINSLIPCDNNNNGGQRYSKPQMFSIKLLQETPSLSSAKERSQICRQVVDISPLRLYELYEMWKAPLLIINNSQYSFLVHLVVAFFYRMLHNWFWGIQCCPKPDIYTFDFHRVL